MSENFIPKHGGYKKLLSYQKSEIIYDGTVFFTRKYFNKFDRTVDQMIQAARSGKQNIAEASMASGTSKETEIKLTNVARASLEELLIDYLDFLRSNKLLEWRLDHPYTQHLRLLNRNKPSCYQTFQKGIEHENPEISANVMIGLIRIALYLLYKQIGTLEKEFLRNGGLRERMTKARRDVRNQKNTNQQNFNDKDNRGLEH
jgi:four helix bundle suffix protein